MGVAKLVFDPVEAVEAEVVCGPQGVSFIFWVTLKEGATKWWVRVGSKEVWFRKKNKLGLKRKLPSVHLKDSNFGTIYVKAHKEKPWTRFKMFSQTF